MGNFLFVLVLVLVLVLGNQKIDYTTHDQPDKLLIFIEKLYWVTAAALHKSFYFTNYKPPSSYFGLLFLGNYLNI